MVWRLAKGLAERLTSPLDLAAVYHCAQLLGRGHIRAIVAFPLYCLIGI